MPARKPKYVFATATTLVMRPGRYHLRAGQTWHADHPVVAEHPSLFSEDPPEVLPRDWVSPVVEQAAVEPVVEQATKAPGEKRASRRDD